MVGGTCSFVLWHVNKMIKTIRLACKKPETEVKR